METSLSTFRDQYLEALLRFLWREWGALGVAGQEKAALRHAVDPEALLVFTCTIGRYDPRLFDEVMDWLVLSGRFLNIQRMRNILRRETFGGVDVLRAVADWLASQGSPMKWTLLSKGLPPEGAAQPLFRLPDGRPLPQSGECDSTFVRHGFLRNPLVLRGYSRPFPFDSAACLALRLRALFGVNARGDVLAYLAMNRTGHPREVARELYYSQKAIHDVMKDMACSGAIQSSREARERTYRLSAEAPDFLSGESGREVPRWVNWPMLLSSAEAVWRKTEELHTAGLTPLVESSEIALTMKPLFERFVKARWTPMLPASASQHGVSQLQAFKTLFETVSM